VGVSVLSEERVIREILATWEGGIDGVIASFEQHCTADLRWCNSGMDDVVGLDGCLHLLQAQHRAWHYTGIETDVRQLVTAPGVGVVERTDTIIGGQPQAVMAVPVAACSSSAASRSTNGATTLIQVP
jgi:limonene-1,2-epoxide hydrolase